MKSKQIPIALSNEESEKIKKFSKDIGLSLASFMRMATLEKINAQQEENSQ